MRIHHQVAWLIGLGIVLAACQSGATPTTTSPTHAIARISATSTPTVFAPSVTASPTVSPTPAPPTFTATRRPSATPRPTTTPSQTSSITPTFDPASIVTVTPAPAAQCPESHSNIDISIPNDPDKIDSLLLTFLNTGGSFETLKRKLEVEPTADKPIVYGKAEQIDVTGDGVAEILANVVIEGDYYSGKTFIFGCEQSLYRVVFANSDLTYNLVSAFDTEFYAVTDMNANGLPEVIYRSGWLASFNSTKYFGVFEWDGSHFKPLITTIRAKGKNTAGTANNEAYILNGGARIEDIDHNGTLELVLSGGEWIKQFGQPEGGPQRAEEATWMWNGSMFILVEAHYLPSEYRFHVIQDADSEAIENNYETALGLYQRVISDETLLGWTSAWLIYQPLSADGNPVPTPTPDAAERLRLEAYARYRIMLLQTVFGYHFEAQTAYQALQEKFPADENGYMYSETAAEFWNEYQVSQNIGMACAKAIAFARQHNQEVLVPLGSQFYGQLNRNYKPEDICPFK